MKFFRLVLTSSFLLVLWLAVAQSPLYALDSATLAATTTFTATQDATVRLLRRTDNFGSVPELEVEIGVVSGERAVALIQFDLTAIPPGSTILSGTRLLLDVTGATGEPDWQLELAQLFSPWDEAVVTYASRPKASTIDGPFFISSVVPQQYEIRSDALTTLVQSWVESTPVVPTNFGLEIDGARGFDALRSFASRETLSNRPPRLEVHYLLPPIRVCAEVAEPCTSVVGASVHDLSTRATYLTDANGYLPSENTIALGHQLWARVEVGSANNGVLYHTSVAPVTVTADKFTGAASAEMRLVVTSAKPLWVQNLRASAQWYVQGDPQRAARLRQQIVAASNYLYAFTDGQFALGRVVVQQRFDGWEDTNLRLYASNALRPNAVVGGIVPTRTADVSPTLALDYVSGEINMGSYWNRFGSPPGQVNTVNGNPFPDAAMADDWSLAFAHELAHYLLFLFDTYTGIDGKADVALVEQCTGTAMGDTYDPANHAFIVDPVHWVNNCSKTEAFATLNGRMEWETIRSWYPWVITPKGFLAGPTPPTALTRVIFVAPSTAPGATAAQLFNLQYQNKELSSGEARAFLVRGDRLIEQGKPAKDSSQVQLTGAEVGDDLCVFDLNDHGGGGGTPRFQFGCEPIAAGDDTLVMTRNLEWAPRVDIRQVASDTVQVLVTQPLPDGAQLNLRLYPEHSVALPAVQMKRNGDLFSAMLTTPGGVPPLYLRLWVDETPLKPATRREAIVDRGVGGGGAFGPASRLSGVLVSSSDGNAQYENPGINDLPEGGSIAWQSMPGTPRLPVNLQISGQSHRLDAFPQQLAKGGTITIQFEGNFDFMQAAESDAAGAAIYFWNGATWRRLATTLTTPVSVTDNVRIASAPSQGVGVYAVLRPVTVRTYLPVVQR